METAKILILVLKFLLLSEIAIKDGNSPNLTVQYNTVWPSLVVFNFDISDVFPRNGQV